MCLAIPGKIISKNKKEYIIDYGVQKRTANLSAIDVKIGDYVIVSNKIIIIKLNKRKAKKFLEKIKNA